MKVAQVAPALPSVSRWLRLCRSYPNNSTLRKLEYERLETLNLQGKVLDVGGGENSRYRDHLPGEIDYSSVNIDPSINPTWLVEVGQPWPIPADEFDHCISFNTLEHVYDASALVAEMHRVLKPGGEIHICVPWMFRIHGHPDDYFRATPSWWQTTLENAGFVECSILPLVWGRYSTSHSFLINNRGLPSHLAHLRDAIYAACLFRGNEYSGSRGSRICNSALGHFISATK